MRKIKLTKKFLISFVFIFLVFFICNKNFSNADFTTAEFIEAVKGVYEMAHNNNFSYGNTETLPPCEDGLIACDRLIARALWDLGVQDQPQGGMTIPIMDEFLTTHGFAKYTNQDEIMPGDIILLNDTKGNTEINAHWHTFVIVTYDKDTGMCTKYDTGSGGRIQAIQPFSVPLFEPGYENRDLIAIYRWTGKLGNIGNTGNLSKLLDKETLNYLMENTDFSEGKPDTYDIFIDENDLDPDDGMEIPVIQTSIDYILYNNDYLSSIDFFNTNSFDNKATLKHVEETLKNELKNFWEKISNFVKDIYKVFLYISIALMLTALILIGLLIAKSAITKNEKLDEKYTEKKMTEQWIISFISLIMIIVIINLTITFTAMISNLTSTYDEDATLLDSVKIYGKAYARSKASTSGTNTNSNGLGTRTDIDDTAVDKDGNNLVARMAPSLHGQNIDSIHDEDGNPLLLTYLTIPHYDFNGQVQQGEMVVHRDLADEVLLIFQELYNIQYPINKMTLVDDYVASDWLSIQHNNTSAFNYRNANNGQTDLDTLSLHAYGKCIDINPLVNPYIVNYWANEDHSGAYTTHWPGDGPEGKNSSRNENDKFIDREGMSGWTDVEKKARAWYDTDILAIFQKYGWDWLDRTGNDTDSQHFQKSDTSSAQKIDWSTVNTSSNTSSSYTINADVSNINTRNIVFIGDSRTEGIRDTVPSDATFICESGQGYDWMVNTAFADASTKIYAGKKVIIWLGVNDLGNIDNYITAVNEKVKDWISKGATVYYAEVGPVDHDEYADNPGIEEFNRKLQEGLSSNIRIIKLYDYLKSTGYTTVDGIHYSSETNQKIYDFLVASVNGAVTVSGSSTTSGNGTSTGTANQTGAVSGTNTQTPFTKYQLTDHQLTGLAAVAFSEQGTPEGASKEASLMANLFETHHNGECYGVKGGDGLYKMVSQPIGGNPYGWFADASNYIESGQLAPYCGGGPVTEEMKAVVKRVLVDGYRTLPLYVDEHDSWSGKDYRAYLNGADVTYDRSSYIPFTTQIDNNYGSHYTFWGWSNPSYDGSDPFGYISEERRAEFGEFHYTFDGDAVLGGATESIEFNFTTNFEGLYMMESNRDWSRNPLQNLFYIICGFILTLFKAIFRCLFIFRMIIIAILLAITPIILIINTVKKIKGNDGIFKDFAIFYAGVLLLKPILGILYAIIAKYRPESIADNPFFIMFPVVALFAFTFIYILILIKLVLPDK